MNVMIAQSFDELQLFASYLLKIYPEFIAQEYIGTPEHEYTVGVLFDMHGTYINAIALRRSILGGLNCRIKVPNATGNKSLGPTLAISSGVSQGEFGSYEDVLQQCVAIAKALKATCSVNLQCRLVEGKVYLFEINPRFSGTTSLRAMVGYNEPDLLIRKHILNEKVQTGFEYRYANIVRGLKEEVFYSDENKQVNGNTLNYEQEEAAYQERMAKLQSNSSKVKWIIYYRHKKISGRNQCCAIT